MSKMLTTDDCKKILFKVGIKFGVSPKLISTRLLDDLDKVDMLDGGMPIEFLEAAVRAWMDAGQPDQVKGDPAPLGVKTEFRHSPVQTELLRAPFVRPIEV